MQPRTTMCDNCPFGHTKAQRHMRNSLRPGRFNEIAQSIWQGDIFFCHKTTAHDDEDSDFYVPMGQERECAGARQFVENAATNRNRAESRGHQ